MKIEYDKDNKERIPFEHYSELFAKADPEEMAFRCNISFDSENKCFAIRTMGENIRVFHPDVKFVKDDGTEILDYPIRIMLLRYFTQMGYSKSTGKLLTYRDVPGGDVYFRNFEGRCLKRLAYAFGYKLDRFAQVMESMDAEKLEMGDVAYRFEFISNMYVVFILWGPDDEYPPSAQILFEDNMAATFTAEDLAVVGDISIGHLKKASN